MFDDFGSLISFQILLQRAPMCNAYIKLSNIDLNEDNEDWRNVHHHDENGQYSDRRYVCTPEVYQCSF